MRSKTTVVSTAVVCLTASMLVASTFIIFNKSYGYEDLRVFFFWSIPFAAGLSFLDVTKIYKFANPRLSRLIAALSGIIAACIWTLVVTEALGQWVNSFSFPILPSWAAGGASGLIFASGEVNMRHTARDKILPILLTCFLMIAITQPLSIWLSGDQRLEITFLKWTPGSEVLAETEVLNKYGITKQDLSRLVSMGIKGKLEPVSGGYWGKGKDGHVIVIAQQQLATSTELPQPDKCKIVYLQDKDGRWAMYPTDSPTLKRKIHLVVPGNNKATTNYYVDLANGGREGGIAYDW